MKKLFSIYTDRRNLALLALMTFGLLMLIADSESLLLFAATKAASAGCFLLVAALFNDWASDELKDLAKEE